MKLKNLSLIVTVFVMTISFNSCKKDNKSSSSTDTTTEAQAQASDQTTYNNESNAVSDDVNTSLDVSGGSFNARTAGVTTPPLTFTLACDFSVAFDTASVPHTMTLTYSGSCSGTRSRTGIVVVSFSPDFKWGSAGAQLTVKYNNLKITRLSDGKSIVLNGTRVMTNVSGGLLKDLATLTNVIHTFTDNMSVTFDNTTQRTWTNSYTRTFTYGAGIVISTTGSGSGTNRFGHPFTNTIIEPLVISQSCDFRYISGSFQNKGSLVTTTTTFGLDASGTAVSNCPATLYYKIEWLGVGGKTATYIGPY
jgi:hypothetical protein